MNLELNSNFTHPSRWIIYGPSGAGKSSFVEKLMLNSQDLFGFTFDTILYCSGQSFPKIKTVNGVRIMQSDIITKEYINELNNLNNNLIIIDDNMYAAGNDIVISDLFTKKSHHKNVTIIILLQNLYPKSKYIRDISINSNYIVLMKNPREITQIRTLSHQIDGDKSDFILKAYKDATFEKPYSYLLLDLCQNTPETLKVRSNIFPDEKPQIVYQKIQ